MIADRAETGPSTPPGWETNPSAWSQRVPIVATAAFNAVLVGVAVLALHHAAAPTRAASAAAGG